MCYWVICYFCLCPGAWKWKSLTFIMYPENLSVILNSWPQSKMLGLYNLVLCKAWSSWSYLPLRFAALSVPRATFLCLSPLLNSIKGQTHNSMSSNSDVSKPSPRIPFLCYFTPNLSHLSKFNTNIPTAPEHAVFYYDCELIHPHFNGLPFSELISAFSHFYTWERVDVS